MKEIIALLEIEVNQCEVQSNGMQYLFGIDVKNSKLYCVVCSTYNDYYNNTKSQNNFIWIQNICRDF